MNLTSLEFSCNSSGKFAEISSINAASSGEPISITGFVFSITSRVRRYIGGTFVQQSSAETGNVTMNYFRRVVLATTQREHFSKSCVMHTNWYKLHVFNGKLWYQESDLKVVTYANCSKSSYSSYRITLLMPFARRVHHKPAVPSFVCQSSSTSLTVSAILRALGLGPQCGSIRGK